MTCRKWLVCGLTAILTVGLSNAMAQDAGGAKKAKRGDGAARAGRKAEGGKARAGRGPAGFDYAGVASDLGLTKEQSEKLAGLIINQQILLRSARLNLTDDQKNKIRALCLETGKELLAADARSQALCMKTLEEKVRNDVLTEEQRTMQGGRGKAAGAGDGKAAGAGEGKAGRKERAGKGGARGGGAVVE